MEHRTNEQPSRHVLIGWFQGSIPYECWYSAVGRQRALRDWVTMGMFEESCTWQQLLHLNEPNYTTQPNHCFMQTRPVQAT